jgi:hypothetical protein
VPVSSLQTFLRADHLDYYFTPPTIVRLSDHGFGPGRRVRISTIGAYAVPNVTQAFLVFSRDERLLDRAQPHRVPGAVQSEAPAVVTGITPFDAWTTDIPEDFVADAAGIELTIPQGAHYLFLGFGDTWYADNSGSLQLVIQALPGCVAGQPPAAGLSCVLADGAAGACDGVCDCVACTAEPALCE